MQARGFEKLSYLYLASVTVGVDLILIDPVLVSDSATYERAPCVMNGFKGDVTNELLLRTTDCMYSLYDEYEKGICLDERETNEPFD